MKLYFTHEHQEAFNKVKSLLNSDPLLEYPDFEKTFILTTHASNDEIAAILSQQYDSVDFPCTYASQSLNQAKETTVS